MRIGLNGWIVVMALLGTTAYAISEEITLTTYYPSPRGVYNELRTAGNVQFGTLEPFDPPESAPRLYVVQDSLTAPAVRVQARAGAEPTTVFTIDHDGNVGVGPADPDARIKLDVQGGLRVGSAAAANAPAGTIQWIGTRFQGSFGLPEQETWRDFVTVQSGQAGQPGVQMTYVAGTRPGCDGLGGFLTRKWVQQTCAAGCGSPYAAGPPTCTTGTGWSPTEPSCSYEIVVGSTYDQSTQQQIDVCATATCHPTWEEAICMGN